MAGDWMKMRKDLQSHPKVVRISSATRSDKFRVVGGLHAVWGVFDTHSDDGILPGYTMELMDHVIGWDGFSAAVASVGWLEESPQGLVMPEFSEHNGQSAKRRAEDQKRKRDSRRRLKSVPDSTGQNADKMRTVDESERRGDKKNISTAREESITPDLVEVTNYGRHLGFTDDESHNFWAYNQARDWELSGGVPVADWQALMGMWRREKRIGGGT